MGEELNKERIRELAKKRLERKQLAQAPSEEDAYKLIEELRIHQEELNIQNEELLRVQIELEAARAKYFQLYDLAPVGYITLNKDLIVREANLVASSLMGTDRNIAINKRISIFISPECQELLYLHFRMVAQGGGKQKHVFTVQRKDGSNLLIQFESNLISDGPEKGFRSILTDVTELKKYENALSESEKRFRTLSEATFEGIVIHANGIILDVNQATLEQTGRSREEVIGRSILEFFSPDSQAVFREGFQRPVIEAYEAQLIRKDGEWRTVQINSRAIEFEGRTAWVTTIMDITDLKRTEENLRRSNDELQQFAYVASHDLQEPLRMITSYLALLNKKYGNELNDQAKGYMAYVVDGAARMRELINDLLQFSRIETRGKGFSSVDMNQVAEKVIAIMHVALNDSKAIVTLGTLPTVWGDETQLSQVLQNLLSNAIKYRGAEVPIIEITSRQDAKEWTISVKDNGIGIDPMFQDKLFHMFQRLHTMEKYPGTGIGLAISKKIVERHGGRIWFESEVGNGSTFYFTMPKTGGGGVR